MDAENVCVLCETELVDQRGRNLGAKGLHTIKEVSSTQKDGISMKLQVPGHIYVHDLCYKSYVKQPKGFLEKINSKILKSSEAPCLRSEQCRFDYPTHCLFCMKRIDFEDIKRHPERHSEVSCVELVDRSKASLLQSNLLKKCLERTDAAAVNLKARIEFAGDLRAYEAKYHRDCHKAFLKGRSSNDDSKTCKTSNRLDVLNSKAFLMVTEWLSSDEGKAEQHTLNELREKMYQHLPQGVPAYSVKHIKRRLQNYFGQDIIITEISGKANIVTMQNRATSILHDTYHELPLPEELEDMKTAKTLAGKIKNSVVAKCKGQSSDFYPSGEDMNLEKLSNMIPETLATLLSNLSEKSRSEKAQRKNKLVETSIGHVMMQFTGPNTYISPLLLSIGVFIHHTTRSRVLIDVLSSLGLCVSYSQIIDFERSAAVAKTPDGLPIGVKHADDGVNFCQWVADNLDYNEDTLSGADTTHVMGSIICQSPKVDTEITAWIPRGKIAAAKVAEAGSFKNLVKYYNAPIKSNLEELILQKIPRSRLDLRRFEQVDNLWLCSRLLAKEPPSWQGFMSEIVSGHFECTGIVFNPVIPLNPETNEAIYSTMIFVRNQMKQMGLCCGALTFDQPLYIKASKIKADNSEFNDIHLRLGGFHQLMSFLGAGCKLMEGSGLEELWETVYARKSIPKMMEGKAYSKCLRACLLTDAALHLILLQDRGNYQESVEDFGESLGDKELPIDEDDELLDDDDNDPDANINSEVESAQENIKEIDFELESRFKNPHPCVSEMLTENLPSPFLTTVIPADLLNQLRQKYKKFLSEEDWLDNASTDKCLEDLSMLINHVKVSLQGSRTAQLWIQFTEFVSTVRMFVRAERMGLWKLHLAATERMLPIFAAVGHNHYAKSARLYHQDFSDLCACFRKAMEGGLFTVRRNESRFWSGTWSDMAIEQALMRSAKTQGGLINITHKEAARTKWLLSAHILAQYSDSLRHLTNTITGTWSEQHREMSITRRKQDVTDLQKLASFLHKNNPFASDNDTELRNIATGVVADHRVNADKAVEVGMKIQGEFDGARFGDIKFAKKNQVATFAVMRKSVKAEGKDIFMSSSELFQRLFATACADGPPDPNIFTYELAAVPPSLFHDDGSMRKTTKSILMNHLISLSPEATSEENIRLPDVLLYDGCALLHRLQWPKIGTLGSFCELFVSVVKNSPTRRKVVVFDSYDRGTTKESEQKRRRLQTLSSADILVDDHTPLPSDKKAFLSNTHNKQGLINMLGRYLEKSGVDTHHAKEEGDADVVIARKALYYANTNDKVEVIADDTDIFILLLYHAKETTTISMRTKQRTIQINCLQKSFSQDLLECLPFVHAMSGCDTTSALFGIGKLKVFKLLVENWHLRETVFIFGNTDARPTCLSDAGEQILMKMYRQGKAKSLDELRHLYYVSPKYKAIERMPPTSRAAYYHCLRVHLQVNTWIKLGTVLCPEDYGFKRSVSGELVPVMTDKYPAPESLLKNMCCKCQSKDKRCSSCGCTKKRLTCSIYCKCEGMCGNPVNLMLEEEYVSRTVED